MKNIFKNISLGVLIITPILVSISVIINFFYIGWNNFDKFKVNELEKFGMIGDFFSGHINGFILLTLIASLYFQRISVKQTLKSVKQQVKANQITNEALKRSLEYNELQKKEFITISCKSDFSEEIHFISSLEKELNIQYLYDSNFKKNFKVNNQKLFELFKRINYLASLLNNTEDKELEELLKKKFETSTMGKYNHRSLELLENVFVFNEILKILHEYLDYLNKQHIKESPTSFEYIYEFLMTKKQNQLGFEDINRFTLFEEISSKESIFESNVIDKQNLGFKVNLQGLWEMIFGEIIHYDIKNYYKIIIKDYESSL